MLEIHRLYPQYRIMQDRREQNTPVSFERRSGIDRRSEDRVSLDTNLTRDIFEIKSKVSQMQKSDPKTTEKISFTQNVSKAAQNSIKTDQFIKTTKPNPTDDNKKDSKPESSTALAAGILASVLGGIVTSAFLGPVGVGIAIGIGTYFGLKLLKQVVNSHLEK